MDFSIWDESAHNSPAANKSFEKALKMDAENILRLDKENQTAVFSAGEGAEDDYNTTMSHCDCQDFIFNKKGKAPCKHIYRLALECGAIDPDAEPWASYKNYSKVYSKTIEKIKSLDFKSLSKLNDCIDTI